MESDCTFYRRRQIMIPGSEALTEVSHEELQDNAFDISNTSFDSAANKKEIPTDDYRKPRVYCVFLRGSGGGKFYPILIH